MNIGKKDSDNPIGHNSGCEKPGANLVGRGISRQGRVPDSKSRTCYAPSLLYQHAAWRAPVGATVAGDIERQFETAPDPKFVECVP